MKLLGRDIPARELLARIEERLRTRGLPTSEPVEVPSEGVEPRVEPLTFNLHALEENADAMRALPLQTHRGGVGQLVVVAKWAFRKSCQVFINETLGRQRVFNGHVRDSYAQLSAEVLRLRREVEQLRARQVGAAPVEAPVTTPPKPSLAHVIQEARASLATTPSKPTLARVIEEARASLTTPEAPLPRVREASRTPSTARPPETSPRRPGQPPASSRSKKPAAQTASTPGPKGTAPASHGSPSAEAASAVLPRPRTAKGESGTAQQDRQATPPTRPTSRKHASPGASKSRRPKRK